MIRCREIGTAYLDAVADLLARGFARRSRDYWMSGLRRSAVREVPEGFPRFGCMLDHEGTPVGVLLLIYTARDDGGGTSIRCNLSSWYVEPAYRTYAPMLTNVAQRHNHVTYVNISPAHGPGGPSKPRDSAPIAAACSSLFRRCRAWRRGMRVEVVQQDRQTVEGLSEADVALLARHAACGCLSRVCCAGDGRRFPFVLQPMRIRRIALPAMQLIYCPDVADYVACAGAIGRFLLRRGRISVALDANGRMKDLVGLYRGRLGRKYFKGPQRPRLADLSDSELVIYGP